MKKQIAKKTIILYVLKMLEKGSSKEKPITQTNITKVLNSLGYHVIEKLLAEI